MEGGTIIPIRCNPRENRYNSRERGEKGEKFRRIHRKKIDIRRKDDHRGRGERGRSRRDKFLPIPQLQITRSLLKLNWNTVEGWGGGLIRAPLISFTCYLRWDARLLIIRAEDPIVVQRDVQVDFCRRIVKVAPLLTGLAARPIRTEMSDTGAPLPPSPLRKGRSLTWNFYLRRSMVITVITRLIYITNGRVFPPGPAIAARLTRKGKGREGRPARGEKLNNSLLERCLSFSRERKRGKESFHLHR